MRPRILLTNDDSHDSPLFQLAIEAFRELGEVHIAVPADEQSWKGKSMTRFEPIYAHEILLHGHHAWSVTGTPADCVNLAIHNLLDAPPDIVVSGINIGVNTGLGFLLASGTVGACLEANIAGIPAIALSQHLRWEDFRYWHDEREFREATMRELSVAVHALVPRVWAAYGAGAREPVTWSVNFPIGAVAETEIVHAHLGASFYGQCFVRHGDQYRHEMQPFESDRDPTCDGVVVSAGKVSATRIDVRTFGQGDAA